jgi:hypothetical protein
MASLPIEIAQLPTASAVSSSTRMLVQNGVAGTPYEQTTLGTALNDLLDEIGSGTVVAGSVLITSGTATLQSLTATVAALGTVTISGGTGTLATGAISTLTVSGTATVGTVAATVLNAGTVDISGGKASLTSGTITTTTTGSLIATAGTIGTLNVGTVAIAGGTGTLSAATVSGTATVGHLAATTGSVATLTTAGTATVGHVAATTVAISGGTATLSAGAITSISATTLAATGVSTLGTVIANAGTVTLGKGTVTDLASTTLAASGTATVGHLAATTGTIATLTATTATVGTLAATGGTATALTIDTATIKGGTGTLSAGAITSVSAVTLAATGVSTLGTLIANAGTATLQQATITQLVAAGETLAADTRYLFPSADLDDDASGLRATDINGRLHVPSVTTGTLTVDAIAGAASFESFSVTTGTIAGDVYVTDARYLFPSVALDDDGAGYAAEDINGGQHLGAITAPEATIPVLNGTVTAGGLITEGATIAGGAITADTRHLFVDAVTDATGAGMLAIDAAGNLHLSRITGASLRMTADPVSGDDVVRFSYFQANSGGAGYLEPATYADAPTDGVTDASAEVETTIAAVLALDGRQARKMSVDNIYQTGSLATNDIDNIIPVGDGELVGNDHYKLVIPTDAPPLPPPSRTLVVRRDLPNYCVAVQSGNPIIVVITGDSTSGRNVAGMNFMSSPYSIITRYLQAGAPGKSFVFYMRGIGGTTMAELDSVPDWGEATLPVWYDVDDTTPWLDVIAALSPHLVVVHGGRNQNASVEAGTILSVVEKVWGMGADCLLVNSYGEVPITGDDARNDRLAVGGLMLSIGTSGGFVGCVDTIGYENLARFGFDPYNLAPMRSGGWFEDGQLTDAITDLPLPYTCPTAAHGWSLSVRIPAGKWTTMGNELWFQIGNEHNTANQGQRLELRRTGANMIEWRIMVTSIAAGASEDWEFIGWTETGITVTDSDLVKFDVGQMGNHIVLNWRDGGTPTTLADLSYSPVDVRVPRAGGAYQMRIGCAAGSVTGCVMMSTGIDGKSSGCLAVPIPEQLYMPVLTGAEFAPLTNTDLALWGGNGPHPSALVAQYVTIPVFDAQDWSAY